MPATIIIRITSEAGPSKTANYMLAWNIPCLGRHTPESPRATHRLGTGQQRNYMLSLNGRWVTGGTGHVGLEDGRHFLYSP